MSRKYLLFQARRTPLQGHQATECDVTFMNGETKVTPPINRTIPFLEEFSGTQVDAHHKLLSQARDL